MNALRMAERMLGSMELTPDQLAQLHALNRKYAQRAYTLLHERGASELTEAEEAELRARLRSDILAMLTPEQRLGLGPK
jgi:Spy/CpxP family protein refolding chaperone